jgi:hypothetical protein
MFFFARDQTRGWISRVIMRVFEARFYHSVTAVILTDLETARRRCRAALAHVQAAYAARAPARSDQVSPAQLGEALEMFSVSPNGPTNPARRTCP